MIHWENSLINILQCQYIITSYQMNTPTLLSRKKQTVIDYSHLLVGCAFKGELFNLKNTFSSPSIDFLLRSANIAMLSKHCSVCLSIPVSPAQQHWLHQWCEFEIGSICFVTNGTVQENCHYFFPVFFG